MYRLKKMVIPNEITEWDNPKINSYAPSDEKNKFAKRTPNTIPKKYFLLNTMR